jgi:hypothetical protein
LKKSIVHPVTTKRRHNETDNQGLLLLEGLQERSLDVSTKEFLSAERAFTYEDLYPMVRNESTVAWMTPHTAIARVGRAVEYYWKQLGDSCCFYFSVDGKSIVAFARTPEHLLKICDVVLRLLAGTVVHSVILKKMGFWLCCIDQR